MVKLKLKNPGAGAPAPEDAANSAPQPPTPSAAPKLALKIKKVNPPPSESADGATGDAPKQKRKYTKKPKEDNGQPSASKPKKRPLEDGEEAVPAKRKSKPTLKSLALVQQSDDEDDLPAPAPPPRPTLGARTPSVKISLKPKGPSVPKPAGTAILKVKGAGKPPVRPPGVGYDSEADEAEKDPAIESQFVLRMPPGKDCDLLRKAIEDKTIGKSVSQGGPGVHFRFLDREGRRTLITIQGRMYAATMVELPCVIESLKSWNKKDWVKAADVCQMLLVLGEVKSEEDIKKYPRPPEVEPDSFRYPHGLTPPMYRVRKRRFRPRKSYLDVERIETNTEKLLQDDERAEDSKYELIESGAESDEASSDEDAQGEEDEDMMGAQDYVETPQENQIEADDLMQMLQDEFMADDVQVEYTGAEGDDDLFGGADDNATSAVLDMQMPATAHDVAMHALAQNANIVLEPESAASTPAAATSNDDDDDDDADDDDDEDPEAAQKQQQIEELKEQISELNKAIQEQEQKRDGARNDLWKKRIQARIDQQLRDLDVKRTQLQQLGETED